MIPLGKKMEYIKAMLGLNKDLSEKKVLFINEQGEILGGDAINEEMIRAHRGRVSPAGMKSWFMETKDRFANKLIETGMKGQEIVFDPAGFMDDRRASGDVKGVAMLIVGGIVVIKLASTLLPQAAADWSSATAVGGAMANSSASDKSTWNTGGSLIPVFGILIVAGIALRAFGH